jgi:ribosomal protein L23
MALFSRDKKEAAADKKDEKAVVTTEEKVTAAPAKKQPASTARATDRDLASVLIKPRITEKAVGMSGNNVYTFIVRRDATKYDVADAIKAFYNVTPVKVNIVNKQPRSYKSRSRNRVVSEKGMKKAYVYLKQGDSISLV